MNLKALEFISCLKLSRKFGFHNYSILTHAWHESDGFRKVIGLNNFWGIKLPEKSVWDGRVAEVVTHEYELIKAGETEHDALLRCIKKYGVNNLSVESSDGRFWFIRLPQRFRDWDSCSQAIEWYCTFIARLYPNAYAMRAEPQAFFEGLVNGKYIYATDPHYVASLNKLYAGLLKNSEVVMAVRRS